MSTDCRYILLINDYDLWRYIFIDIESVGGSIQAFPFDGFKSSSLEQCIFKFLYNKKTKKLLGNAWFRHLIRRWGITNNKKTIIVFLNPVLPYIESSLLEYLQERINIQICVLFVDTVKCLGESRIKQIDPLLKYFQSRIYSFDEADALKYNWSFTQQYYSKLEGNSQCIWYDAFLVLYNKGRAEKALCWYDHLEKLGWNCIFYINGVSDDFKKRYSRPGIIYNKTLDYKDIIAFVNHSRAVIELCQPGQTSSTLRAFEAVVYNKLLLTDNPNIIRFPYYDTRFMKYIKSLDELDKIDVKISCFYHYDLRFSPVFLFDQIRKTFND